MHTSVEAHPALLAADTAVSRAALIPRGAAPAASPDIDPAPVAPDAILPACHQAFDLHEASQQRAAHVGGGELTVRYWPESPDTKMHSLPTDAIRMLVDVLPPDITQGLPPAMCMQLFERVTNYRVVAVVGVEHRMRMGFQDLLRVNFGLTAQGDVMTVFHGTPGEHVDSITRTGLRGAACRRAKSGRGVYTTRDFWEAVAYSPPDGNHWQYVLRCDLVCGSIKQGVADQVDFGVDARGAPVLTSTCAAGRVMVPLQDAQLVVRDIIVMQQITLTPSWAQVAAVRFYNQWQLWNMVHHDVPSNVLGDNKTRLVGDLRVPAMVVTARSPGAAPNTFGCGARADQRRMDGARKHAQRLQQQADAQVTQADLAAEYANMLEARHYAAVGRPFMGMPGTAAPPWCLPDTAGVEHRASSGGFCLNETVTVTVLSRPDEVGLFGETGQFSRGVATIRQISRPPGQPVTFFLEMHSALALEEVFAYNSKRLAVHGRVLHQNFNHLAVLVSEMCKIAGPGDPAPKKRRMH